MFKQTILPDLIELIYCFFFTYDLSYYLGKIIILDFKVYKKLRKFKYLKLFQIKGNVTYAKDLK